MRLKWCTKRIFQFFFSKIEMHFVVQAQQELALFWLLYLHSTIEDKQIDSTKNSVKYVLYTNIIRIPSGSFFFVSSLLLLNERCKHQAAIHNNICLMRGIYSHFFMFADIHNKHIKKARATRILQKTKTTATMLRINSDTRYIHPAQTT